MRRYRKRTGSEYKDMSQRAYTVHVGARYYTIGEEEWDSWPDEICAGDADDLRDALVGEFRGWTGGVALHFYDDIGPAEVPCAVEVGKQMLVDLIGEDLLAAKVGDLPDSLIFKTEYGTILWHDGMAAGECLDRYLPRTKGAPRRLFEAEEAEESGPFASTHRKAAETLAAGAAAANAVYRQIAETAAEHAKVANESQFRFSKGATFRVPFSDAHLSDFVSHLKGCHKRSCDGDCDGDCDMTCYCDCGLDTLLDAFDNTKREVDRLRQENAQLQTERDALRKALQERDAEAAKLRAEVEHLQRKDGKRLVPAIEPMHMDYAFDRAGRESGPSAVASAPAYKPGPVICCQSQFDIDE